MAAQIIRALDQAAVAAVTHFNGHWATTAYTLSQTALIHKETTDPTYSQHARTIQSIFNLIDIGSVLWGIKTVARELNNKYQITAGSILAAVTLFFFATQLAVSRLEKYFTPYKEPKDLLKDLSDVDYSKISIQFNLPPSHFFAQQLYAARIILNLALSCLSEHRALALIRLTAHIYSSYQLFQLKWLNLSRTIQFNGIRFDQIKNSYRCLLTPAGNETCDICKDEDDKSPTSYFCSTHAFHDGCIAKTICAKANTFLEIHSIKCHKATVKQETLPRCPLQCPELYPHHGHFDINVHDPQIKQSYRVPVTITDIQFTPMSIFAQCVEGLNLVYNGFQTALATFQQSHPELAGQLLFAQRIMLLTDAIALASDLLQLYWKQEKDPKPLKEKIRAATLSILGALAILLISIKMKPSFDLKKSLALHPEQRRNVTVFWATPRLHQLSQLILTTRVALGLFFACTTEKKQRALHMLGAFSQSLTLYKISQLPWLKFERTLKNPEGSILKELTIGSHILLQEPADAATVSPTIQSLYNYFTNYFNGSKNWSGYWIATKRHGIELSRTRTYDVTVAPRALEGLFPPYINHITASGIHPRFGAATVNLK